MTKIYYLCSVKTEKTAPVALNSCVNMDTLEYTWVILIDNGQLKILPL